LFNTYGTAEKQNQIQKGGETQQLLPAFFFSLTKKDQKKYKKGKKKSLVAEVTQAARGSVALVHSASNASN